MRKLLIKIAFITLVVALLSAGIFFAAQHALGENNAIVLPTIVVDEEITATLGQTKTINAVLKNTDGTIDDGNKLLYGSTDTDVLTFADATKGVFKVSNSSNLPEYVLVKVVHADNAGISATVKVMIVVKSATLTFDYNGATSGNSLDTLTVYYGTAINGLPQPSMDNYTFDGWYAEVDGAAVQLQDGDRYPYMNDLTLLAHFKTTLRFDGQGSESLVLDDTYFNEPLPVLVSPERTGYTFDGWFTAPNGQGRQYQEGDKFTQAVPTLFAGWTANRYTVRYDANGGTGGPTGTIDATYGQPFALISTKPTYNNYRFFGWATDKAAATASFSAGEEVSNLSAKQSGEVVLYAIWGIRLTFDANGGEAAPAPQNVTLGHEVSIPSATPERTGYQFLGWSSNQYADSAEFSAGMSYTRQYTRDATLYAVWGARKYVVSYVANIPETATSAVSGTTPDSEHYYDFAFPLSSNGFSLYGHTFLWWTLTIDGSGESFKGGQYVKNLPSADGGTVKLYAQWAKNDTVITYNANKPPRASAASVDGEVEPTILTAAGVSAQLSREKFTLVGWHQTGWADSAGKTYTFGQTVSKLTPDNASRPITFNAVWEANTYTIAYNTDGGNVVNSQTATYDTELTLAPAPTREGYRFVHWVDASGNIYTAAQRVKNLTPINSATFPLTAIWEPIDTD
jgi:uncharacterized repeat protein (TIGR02543 family)